MDDFYNDFMLLIHYSYYDAFLAFFGQNLGLGKSMKFSFCGIDHYRVTQFCFLSKGNFYTNLPFDSLFESLSAAESHPGTLKSK